VIKPLGNSGICFIKIVYSAREQASRAFPSLYIGRLDNLIVRTGLKSMDDSAEERY